MVNLPELRPIGPDGAPHAKLKGQIQILTAMHHVELIQVGYLTEYGDIITRQMPDEDAPDMADIVSVEPEFTDEFNELHAATGSQGWLETVFIAHREYAVFIFPFSL
ncbi:hypothetical protein [Inquilinus limosus]|uniref:Uncharacterized protein n=1 Tax=Inquilinus limosus MP06 TaxID=1398085 RepID=A0A0A0DGP4_9PROT|nr:hypothetical protein [Inquilinus limosus]KGM36172.1 hypothetical protein P409_00560 [Inquilinus limosus MP06]